jgi:hypothetical protein
MLTETPRHLFLHCSFTKNCWAAIEVLVPSWLRAAAYMKRHINKLFVMEVIIIMSCAFRRSEIGGFLIMRIQVFTVGVLLYLSLLLLFAEQMASVLSSCLNG